MTTTGFRYWREDPERHWHVITRKHDGSRTTLCGHGMMGGEVSEVGPGNQGKGWLDGVLCGLCVKQATELNAAYLSMAAEATEAALGRPLRLYRKHW